MTEEEAKAEAEKGIEVVTKDGTVKNKVETKEPTKDDVKTESGNKVTDVPKNETSSGGSSGGSSNKPSNGGSAGNGNSGSSEKPADKPADKPSNGGGSNKPSHEHSWTAVYKTVNHPEQGHNEQYVTKPAWTENIPIWGQDERSICNQCGKDITGGESAHNKAHAMAGEPGGWHSEWVDIQIGTDTINHPAEYGTRWVVDKAAWSEQVLDYYKCSCGATK